VSAVNTTTKLRNEENWSIPFRYLFEASASLLAFEITELHWNFSLDFIPVTHDARLQQAVHLHQMGRLKEAAEIYKELLIFLPHHTVILNNLATVFSNWVILMRVSF
jgi:hypothetical protein